MILKDGPSMISLTKVEGVDWEVKLRLPVEDDDVSCYFSGNFACNGDGALTLHREGSYWEGKFRLQSGVYSYYLEVNQFLRMDENRNPLDGTLRLVLKQDKPVHLPQDSSYGGNSGGMDTVRIICPPDTANVAVVTDHSNEEHPSGIFRDEAVAIFEFVLPPNVEEYSFTLGKENAKIGPFRHIRDERCTPEQEIVYQIFPDRFRRSGPKQARLADWNTIPTPYSFFGGDFRGISEKISHLKYLGVNHLYMTPFFKSRSNHRYDVDDYYEVDPLLGSNQDLIDLSEELWKNGISMIMDVVFNHTSTNYRPFAEAILDHGSPYVAWYKFLSESPRIYHDHFVMGTGKKLPDYETFQGHGGMPKLNHQNTGVREMMLGVLKHYARKLHVSHFRYDVSDSIDLDSLSSIIPVIRGDFPDIEHIAEIWCVSPLFFGEGLYDSSMNYPLRDMIIGIVSGTMDASEFNSRLIKLKFQLGERRLKRMMNLLGSHDTARIRTVLGNPAAALLSYAILLVMDGMPTIYYGDEVGMEGGPDPDCRRTFPWDSYDAGYLNSFRELIQIRKKYPITRDGYAFVQNKSENMVELVKKSRDHTLTLLFATDNVVTESIAKVEYSAGVQSEDGSLVYSKYGFTISMENAE